MANSSWKVGQWTTPTTEVTVPPVPSEVSPESKSQISTSISGQLPSFIREDYPTFIEFVKAYYKSQELKGYPIDIIQNWTEYYNIDNYGDLVTETKLISTLTATSTTIDVESTRDFPKEGLLLIDDEIIYYNGKDSTLFNNCSRGFDAVKAVGDASEFIFSETTASEHALGTTVVNLNNIFPLYMLGKFKEQYLATYPKNFTEGVTESTIIKRIKDFYASKGSTRSFQFVLRTLFGVESAVTYPRDRIFKPSDAYYTSREVIRAVAISGNPSELVGQVLYQEADPTDTNIQFARIYVKGVVEAFTENGRIYEIDVDTDNSIGTFVTPYKTVLSEDLSDSLSANIVTVDSTIGWPEENGRFRIEDEIINYAEKTVNQFLGCTRARENTLNVTHIAGQEVISAARIYGQSNVDGSEIVLKVYGGTRGVNINSGGRYYLPSSSVTTPTAPGFDSIDPIWDSFVYNVRSIVTGVSASLSSPNANGSVLATITTKEDHRFKRDNTVRILNADEDIYNDTFSVVGIVDSKTFEILLSASPVSGITNKVFFISRDLAFGTSTDTSINNVVSLATADIQNVYKSDDNAIIASTGIPSYRIGPFASTDLDPGNQRYLKRIPLNPLTKSTKTPTPVGQVGIGVNGVPFFSYKSEDTKKYGGLKSIEKITGGDGYDITNPPLVEFEPEYILGRSYAIFTRVRHNGNRYQAVNTGITSDVVYPTHTSGSVILGTVEWQYEGTSAEASVSVDGRIISINVTNGGSGYTTQPIVSLTGGGAPASTQASATAQITNGAVTGITVTNAGSGYTSLPTVSISGGGGSGATAEPICRGPINSIGITNTGSQYTYEPNITLVSGSGAVAYPSILNGRIESIIVTFGGERYYGAPDVVITGDGLGATAFAQVDLTKNIVTNIVVTNKGIGYTPGNTTIDIIYPGSGARFQTKLTELSYNDGATFNELGVSSTVFTNRKTVDYANGMSIRGSNFLIFGGEYGHMYNPKKLRFILEDNISSNLSELTPTRHSPIIGWAYDGNPIYGPYGYKDPQNKSPFNEYEQLASSYSIKSSRDSLLSGLSDPMGTYIEDYEYTEGAGSLDRYNGRYCVTPEFPNGVYAYFCTVDGTTGNPKFPYFVGPEFYSEADAVNWNGNGLQKNFTEDAIRYKAPYINTDNVIAKRKELDDPIDFFLVLEDTTTRIILETGEFIQFAEDGIGYFDYYPSVRGGRADSLTVSSTNRYSSNGIDQFLVEGPGQKYKVNDRLTFDETGSGGSGLSALVSQVEGVEVSGIAISVDDDDVTTATVTTTENHYLLPNDRVNVTIADNTYERTIYTKVVNSKYQFKYFDLQSADLLSEWTTATSYDKNDLVFYGRNVYKATAAGTSGVTAPVHESGTTSDDNIDWEFVRNRTDGNLYQGGWSSITGGSNYLNGTYEEVPLTTNGSGYGAEATIVVSGGAVTTVTITNPGFAYNVGDTISADNINLGYNLTPSAGSGFTITLTEVSTELVVRTNKAHQLSVGDLVNISGITPSAYNKSDYTVVRSDTLRRFVVKRNFASPAAADVSSAEVYVQNPKLGLIKGHSYKFDTQDSSNDGKTLAFTLDLQNTEVLTYKNITATERDSVTNEQNSITVLIDELPGIFYYFDIEGAVPGSYFNVINEPLQGPNIVTAKTDTTFKYVCALEPETGYSATNSQSIKYSTNSIYATGGIANITIGDTGRNYSSIPKLSGSTRSGAGATAVATIAGFLATTNVTNKGSGYNPASLPTAVVSLPDFVDLTVSNVFGSFIPDEIVISQETQGTQTARARVISWDAANSILRVQPLQNERTGAANKGYIMFTTFAANANRGMVYSSDSNAKITAVSGIQAVVAASIPSSGPDVGRLSEVTVTNPGSNYRSAPTIILDNPYYGEVTGVTITSQNTGNYPTNQVYTGVAQKSVAPTGGINVEFTVEVVGNSISSVTITDGGSTYALGDVITISGASVGGVDVTDDFTLTVGTLYYDDPATTTTTINAEVDSITVTNSGSGYLSAPEIRVTGGNGINSKFNAVILNEGVSRIDIEDGGEQYQNAPVVNIVQSAGTGASLLLKSSNLGQILKISGDNITYNYSHDRTLKPELNTTYNLQLIRTQVINYLDVVDGGANFVSVPTIILEGGSGSLFRLRPVIQNEVIQSVEVDNPGRGFLSAPTVKAEVTHTWVGLQSNSTLNFAYNTKIPTGTEVTLQQVSGTFPAPLLTGTKYYAIAATIANGLADNQIRLATSLANANAGTYIAFTSAPILGATGNTTFTLKTTDLGDNIIAYMKPGTFSVGERIYQGASTTSYTAFGYVRNWDPSGRVVSVEIVEGEFKIGEPVFGEESSAFGQIHDFSRADAVFEVSPISISANRWERTTGILDVNEQRLYDSDRFQEFSYNISSSININDWRSPLKFAAHPAGFKVLGTQIVSQSSFKRYNPRPTVDLNTNSIYNWWVPGVDNSGQPKSFNGTTFVFPKPSASNTGKLSVIKNFGLGKPDYTAAVPTEVQIFGRQLLDIQRIISCIGYKVDNISDRSISFDGSSASAVDTSTDQITLTNHGLVDNQRVIYNAGGDRFQDARDLIVANIDYIVEETIGYIEDNYNVLTDGTKPDYDASICARDTRLVLAAWANDLRYGGNYFTVTAVNSYVGQVVPVGDRYADARNLLRANKLFIAEEAVGRMLADPVVGTPSGFPGVPGGDQNCIDDVVDFIESMSYDLAYGGNSETYDAANLYVGTVHLDGEEPQAIKTFEIAETLCADVINNVAIVASHTSETQVIDNTITNVAGGCTDVESSMATLFTILKNAIQNDTLSGVTRTVPANNILHVGGEEEETIAAYNHARDLCILAINNNLPTGTYTSIAPYTDLSITNDAGGCANVVSAITTLAAILTEGIDNPGTIPDENTGNYPNVRTGDAIGGLASGTAYYVNYVDADTISLRATSGGANIDLTAVGTGPAHQIRVYADGINTKFKIRAASSDISTKIGKTAIKEQLFVIINGLVQNPNGYTFASDILTFGEAPLADSEILCMYYDRASYTTSFQLDQFGDEIKDFDLTEEGLTPGYGYTDGTYTDVPLVNKRGTGTGATADITVSGTRVTNVVINNPGNGYTNDDILGVSDSTVDDPLGVWNYHRVADAARLIRLNTEFIATTAYGRMINDPANAGFVNPDTALCIRDTKLIIEAVADNVEFGGNDATYDAARTYVGSAHLTGEEDESVEVYNHARDICQEVMRNITVTTNSETVGSQTFDLTITDDSGDSTYDTSDCADVASTITTLFGIVSTAIGSTGNPGNLNSVTRTNAYSPEFQVKVNDVTFDGVDDTFTATVGGSPYTLPTTDNFLIFLNSTLQVKGNNESYTYSGSTITFNEAPLPGMDFYGFYFGKLTLLDDIAPFFDNDKRTFTIKENNAPFSLESDNAAVNPSNNLMIFINGVFQEPGVAYQLNGSIIEFSEAPRAGSIAQVYIYTGSTDDILFEDTFNSIDPGDRVNVLSEGEDRLLATVSSASSIDTYEYTGLRPNIASFSATVANGSVVSVQILDQGSNYEVAPILVFQGGDGTGAFAETTIEAGSGRVIAVTNLQGGVGYTSAPTVIPTHPVDIERSQRNRIISNSNALGSSYLTSSITDSSLTLNLQNVFWNNDQRIGFPDEGQVIIPYYDVANSRWTCERILYGNRDLVNNTITVSTGGRGYAGTTASAINIVTGTYTSSGTTCTVTTSGDHYLSTGQRIYLDHTSGDGFDGSYVVTVASATEFTVQYPFSRTASGNVSLLPEVRLRSL